jgi:CRISPR-associated protein Cas2
MYVVVAYDVPDDRRRGRLHKRLRAWLHPVQKSVFEGELPPRSLPKLVKVVEACLEFEQDDVRIYVLCGGCRTSTLLVGRARRVPGRREPCVV